MSGANKDYPRGVEVVAAPIIVNDGGEVLLMQSPKWGDRWVIPGGHVEPGETVFDAAAREGQEEVGLQLKPTGIVNIGELIDDPSFNRRAHLVYFHIRCEVVGGEMSLDPVEVREVKWFSVDDALKAIPQGGGLENTFTKYKENYTIRTHSEAHDRSAKSA